MSEAVIRPSMKLTRTAYTFVFTILVVCVMVFNNVAWLRARTPWLLAIPALLLLVPLKHHIRLRFTKLRIQADSLRYESGLLSRSTRIVKTSLVQDVRIEQGLFQRLIGVGNLTIETVRGEDDLTMKNVDDPERVAELVLGASTKPSDKKKKR